MGSAFSLVVVINLGDSSALTTIEHQIPPSSPGFLEDPNIEFPMPGAFPVDHDTRAPPQESPIETQGSPVSEMTLSPEEALIETLECSM